MNAAMKAADFKAASFKARGPYSQADDDLRFVVGSLIAFAEKRLAP